MNNCPICTTTPEIPKNYDKLVITASHPYMLDKLLALGKAIFEIKNFNSYLEIITKDLELFLEIINKNNFLTEIETENIFLLPLKKDEEIDLCKFQRFKSLKYWITLFEGRDLKEILDEERLVIYFQPIIDLKKMAIYGYECLARGLKKDNSIMNPGEMFRIANATGMLFNLDRQCRIQAINFSKKYQLEGKIFINFTPNAIYNPEFCLKTTLEAMKKVEIEPDRVVFEVIETEKVQNVAHLSHIFKYYRENGVKVALDDVGSGYSTLLILSELKPDYIKIDMELVRNIDKDSAKKVIVKSLVEVAKDLAIQPLAEGIETREELEVISSMGINIVQGYFFGKPSPKPLRELRLY